MAPSSLNEVLPGAPLLSLDTVPDAQIETIADPFPVSHEGRLYVLAEVLGRREPAGPFKTVGIFEIDDGLQRACYLGDALPAETGRYSYPHVVRDDQRYLLIPEVFVPLEGGRGGWLQVLQIWETQASAFPFGWTRLREQLLPGCQAPSDKLLLARNGLWWLFCSDNARRRLVLFTSADLRAWRPHPSSPVVSRDDLARGAADRSLAGRAARAWRLGGGIMTRGGELVLPLQHKYRSGTYGGAVTLLRIHEMTEASVRATREGSPLLVEDPRRPWMAHGAHHVALARHGERIVLATDGFDGRRWTSSLVELPAECGLSPWEPAIQAAGS